MITTVVNVLYAPHTLYIGRRLNTRYQGIVLNNPTRGYWGNPFQVGVFGDHEQCVQLYREWLLGDSEAAVDHRRRLPELRGHTLGCHCLPQFHCHGLVLAELVNQLPELP